MIKAFWTILLLAVGAILLAGTTLPWYVGFIRPKEVVVDLADKLTPEARQLVTNTTITASVKFGMSERGGILAEVKGRAFDWPYTLLVDVDYSLVFLNANTEFVFSFEDEPWRIVGSGSATPRTYRMRAELEETEISEKDRILTDLLSRLNLTEKGIADLAFTARLKAEIKAEKTKKIPVDVWSVKASVKDGAAFCVTKENPISLRGASVNLGAEGIADRLTILPMFPKVKTVNIADLKLENFFAAIRMTENSLLVSEAGAEVCGGELKLYSLFLNPQSLTAGFTLFLDDIDANEVLSSIKDFRGEASGRLHGKLPLFLKNGEELRLKNAYLYSTPGVPGKLAIRDASPILNNLAAGGVDQTTRKNLEKALANLDYNVLKIELRREEEGMALGLKIEGTATSGKTTVPVNFAVTFRGDFEQLINTGIKLSK